MRRTLAFLPIFLLIPALAFSFTLNGKAITTWNGKTITTWNGVSVGSSGAPAFPYNSTPVETFTGADNTTPPNSNWTNILSTGIQIESNQAAGVISATENLAQYNVSLFGPNTDIFAELPTALNYFDLCLLDSNGNGYIAQANIGDGKFYIYRMDALEPTEILNVSVTWGNGDSYGMRLNGGKVQAQRKPSGGSWAQVGTDVSDSTYQVSTYVPSVGIYGALGNGRVDNFGVYNLP